jgi:hypothetical protein
MSHDIQDMLPFALPHSRLPSFTLSTSPSRLLPIQAPASAPIAALATHPLRESHQLRFSCILLVNRQSLIPISPFPSADRHPIPSRLKRQKIVDSLGMNVDVHASRVRGSRGLGTCHFQSKSCVPLGHIVNPNSARIEQRQD